MKQVTEMPKTGQFAAVWPTSHNTCTVCAERYFWTPSGKLYRYFGAVESCWQDVNKLAAHEGIVYFVRDEDRPEDTDCNETE